MGGGADGRMPGMRMHGTITMSQATQP
jgi:hypothetical protein